MSWGSLAACAQGLQVSVCPAGVDAPASVMNREFYSAEGKALKLVLTEDARSIEGCAAIALDAAAEDVAWMSPASRESRESVPRRLTLQGTFAPGAVQVSEIIPHVSEPAKKAPVRPVSPRAPSRGAAKEGARKSAEGGRAAWIWNPQAWRATPEKIWLLGAREGVKTLYLTFPVSEEGEVEAPDSVRAFVATARARGFSVWAVVGDPRDVLPESAPALARRMRAYAFYNRYAPPEARLAGVQLDIEPYLLPGFALSQEHWRGRYVETVLAAREAALGLPVDLVVPVWWGTHPAWGAAVLEPLALPGVSLTVMNYRTHPAALRAGAEPFLAWGGRVGRPVRIALETGPLPDEVRRLYRRVDEGPGSLWLLSANAHPVWVLFRSPRAGLAGRAYDFLAEETFPASVLTFGGDSARLHATARLLSREWRGRPAFAGIALHGLEETYFRE